MSCAKAQEMTFDVYDLYPDGRESDTCKTFSVSKKESNDMLTKFGFFINNPDEIEDNGILIIMFHKLFNFTIGPNGFRLTWELDPNGVPRRFESALLSWPGPRAPAYQCGGAWWRIKRKL